MAEQPTYRIVVVGLGLQGARILEHLAELGHDIVGAVDIGDKVGRPVADFAPSAAVPALTVSDSVFDVLDALPADPDVVAITAALPQAVLLEMSGALLDRGIDVITLHPDVFEPGESWTDTLRERAVAGGATFLATGLQDTWWVQLPAVVASSSVSIETIRIVSTLSLDQLSPAVGDIIGVGLDADAFVAKSEETLAHPAVLGDPLLAVARKIGLDVRPPVRTLDAIYAEGDYEWTSAGIVVSAGHVVGTRETVVIDTEQGIRLEGLLEVLPIDRADTADELHIVGVPEHHLRYHPFDGFEITNLGLVSRIPDVVEAVPGVLFSRELPPARHQLPRGGRR